MKVRVNRQYIFYPVLFDRIHPCAGLVPGDIVTVVNLPGCPRANTMGHAHVNLNGEFAGLVHVNSLHPMSDAALVAARIKEDMGRLKVPQARES